MLRCDHNLLLRRHKVSALLHHFGAGNFPVAPGPMKTIRLPLALNAHAKLPRALGHSHGHIGRINITIRVMVKCPFEILGANERPFCFNFIR